VNAGAQTKKCYKIIVVGFGGVGKSAITVQFTSYHFVEIYDPTIEDSFVKQTVVDDEPVTLSILDTAGQEEYNCLRDQYLRFGNGFLIVFSLTDRTSFEQIPSLFEQILKVFDSDPGATPIVLVGNKTDLQNQRSISKQEATRMADRFRVPYFEASAKTRTNIDESFFQLVREIRKREPKTVVKKFSKKKHNLLCCTTLQSSIG